MAGEVVSRPQPVSLQSVAAEAGVAPSTVSRFVKGQLQLAEGTERRVREAMATLGYDMSVNDKRVAPSRVKGATVAILVPVLDSYYGRFAKLAVAAAEQVGLLPIVASVGLTSLQAGAYVRALISSELAGVISIGTLHNGEVRELLAACRIPLVVVDERSSDGPRPERQIVVDNYSGSRQVVAYLTRLGHSNIAFVSGPREHAAVAERRRGYEDGMTAAGLDFADQFDLAGVCSEAFGFAALTSLLDFAGPRPTAVYVAADEIAAGVLAAASHLQLRVPEDLTVVGFDDIPVARRLVPSLTTIHAPTDMLAEAAVSALFEAMIGQSGERHSVTVIPVSLTVRDSSGPPPP